MKANLAVLFAMLGVFVSFGISSAQDPPHGDEVTEAQVEAAKASASTWKILAAGAENFTLNREIAAVAAGLSALAARQTCINQEWLDKGDVHFDDHLVLLSQGQSDLANADHVFSDAEAEFEFAETEFAAGNLSMALDGFENAAWFFELAWDMYRGDPRDRFDESKAAAETAELDYTGWWVSNDTPCSNLLCAHNSQRDCRYHAGCYTKFLPATSRLA